MRMSLFTTLSWLILITAGPMTGAAELDEGLVAYWDFDGSLSDQAGTFDGKLRGDSPPNYALGQFGSGLRLDGETQYVEISGDPSAFDFNAVSYSVSGWFLSSTNPNERETHLISIECQINPAIVAHADRSISRTLNEVAVDLGFAIL